MTIDKALAAVNSVKPHEYPDDTVIGWLADAEQLILSEIVMWHEPRWRPRCKPKPPAENPLDQEMPPVIENGDGGATGDNNAAEEEEPPKWPPERYTTATSGDTVLLVPDPYSELYVHYLCAQIDYHNAETLRHANSVQMFNAALTQFANWYNRTHMPKQSAFVRI